MAGEESAADWQFACGQCERFFSDIFGATGDFDQHITWTDNCDPEFRSALSLTHTGFEWLLGDWLVREDANPQLPFTLHTAGSGDTRRFDLGTGQPCAVEDLQTVITEIQLVISRRETRASSALHLSVFCALWH